MPTFRMHFSGRRKKDSINMHKNGGQLGQVQGVRRSLPMKCKLQQTYCDTMHSLANNQLQLVLFKLSSTQASVA